MSTSQKAPPHVVVLGAGFGGIGAAQKLRDAPVRLTIVDKHDYHTFQPLLYQVATDLLDTATAARLLGHLRTLLEHLPGHVNDRISALPIVPPEERARLSARRAAGFTRWQCEAAECSAHRAVARHHVHALMTPAA